MLSRMRNLIGHPGSVDALDRYHVGGWVKRGISSKVTISVDGKILTQIVAALGRPDLPGWGWWRARGFDYVFDSPLSAGVEVTVTNESGQHLVHSPQIVPPVAEEDLSNVGDGLTTPVPPADLVFAVVGHRSRLNYAKMRRPPVLDIIARLEVAGIDHKNFGAILDFGCGSGRVLAGWEGLLGENTKLIGCDINPKLIAFCQKSIPFAETFVSDFLPPLSRIKNASVDFIYAASVFTHLNEDEAKAWQQEFKRILKPGGVVLFSFHGPFYDDTLKYISPAGLRELHRRGIYMHIHDAANLPAPGSNHYATFMTHEFVRSLFAGFTLLGIAPSAGFMAQHDVALFRAP